jgi:hypothetical protein
VKIKNLVFKIILLSQKPFQRTKKPTLAGQLWAIENYFETILFMIETFQQTKTNLGNPANKQHKQIAFMGYCLVH